MNILIINGSPKGKYSVTLQTLLFLEKKYPQYTFSTLDAGATIKALEKDFTKAREALLAADAIIFSYPVYTFIATSQLHRFIELTKASGVDLSGKIATQITTSKHFYDVTAHKYVEENCYDMGLNYIRGLSADMDDILTEKGRLEASKFFEFFLHSAEKGIFATPPKRVSTYSPVSPTEGKYEEGEKSDKYDVVIITDSKDDQSQIAKMVNKFRAEFPYKTRIVNISEYPFSGGCLGCFMCAVSGKCVYKDGFDEFLRNEIQKSPAIVYAFTVSDHSMGSRFKMYDDRNFCNGHRTVTIGTPVGYLVSGPYSEESNIQMIIEGRASVGQNFLAGVATDERDTDRQIRELSDNLVFALETHHTVPQNFLGVGGMKIFRDLIFSMRGMMRADHKFYKAHGQYDFPKKYSANVFKMYLVGMLLGNEKIRSKMGSKMKDGMIGPYEKMLKEAFPEK